MTLTTTGIQLKNMRFTDLEEPIDQLNWKYVTVEYKTNNTLYYTTVQHDRVQIEEISGILNGMFEGNRVWIGKVDNGEGFDERLFVFVYHFGLESMYCHHLKNEKTYFAIRSEASRVRGYLKSVEEDYLKKQGFEIETKEDRILSEAEVAFFYQGVKQGKNYRFVNTRKKKLDEDVQVFSLSNRGTRKQWMNYFEEIGLYGKTIPDWGLMYYPDGLVYTGELNSNKNEKKFVVEIELGRHNKKDFLLKLRKIHKKGMPVYFILNDYYKQYHIDLIEYYFVHLKGKKAFRNIYICTVNELHEKGDNAFVQWV